MGLFSRNVAIVMALLVALQAAHAAPTNKDGDGKGGKKGRRSVGEEEVGVDALSALEETFADALAEDAEAAHVLEEQVRARRSLSAPDGEASADAYVEGDASADGAALQEDAEEQGLVAKKKPCRGKKGGSDGDTETTGEAEEMQRQRKGKNKKKKTKESTNSTTESSALVGWLMGDVPEARW